MATLEELMKEAESLSREDREMLAAHLFATLEDDRDPGFEEAWTEEIERRVAEVEQGIVEMRPWSEVRRELLERLAK